MNRYVLSRIILSRSLAYLTITYILYKILFNEYGILFFIIIFGVFLIADIIKRIINNIINYIEDSYIDIDSYGVFKFSKLFKNHQWKIYHKRLIEIKAPTVSKVIHYFEDHNEKGSYWIGGGTDDDGRIQYIKDKKKVKEAILNSPKDYYTAVLRTTNSITQDKKEYFKKALDEHETYRSNLKIGHMLAREHNHRKAIRKYINK